MSDYEDSLADVKSGNTPIIPESGVSGFSLAIVIGVLAFLAGIALTGFFAVDAAVSGWSGELTGTITVQVRGMTPEEIRIGADAAEEILRSTEGLSNVTRLPQEEAEALLEPWLGMDNLPDDLPLPVLITADVTPELRADLGSLRQTLVEAVPSASLNDHGAWTDQLVAAASRIRGLAFMAFVLVILASSAVIVFAARAGLAAHRNIVEVLHLVGATDSFIAQQIGNRYLMLGLVGGSVGALAAWLATKFLAVVTGDAGGFLPAFSIDAGTAVWLLSIPILLGGLSTIAARVAVLRALRGEDRYVA
ncbi:cell division protein FtsX [Parvularcula lutaonensis]|uniref:Cell division protein FtsX n=1 Tax=Parvularcula lutaonensis TaxID=491923 RepID=A0ABV7MEM4_9PROT|nr:FtsX-like permease family protein [Parvularcula lutaonensis]GGY55092.1 cell division protein [Parvularcula lutaonensis]